MSPASAGPSAAPPSEFPRLREPLAAVTFDFYDTLAHHRTGVGRGVRYREYLASVSLAGAVWEHQVLYDVFEYYAEHYTPTLAEPAKRAFWVEFTRRLFVRTGIGVIGPADPSRHAESIRRIMGPQALRLFPDVPQTLRGLRARGLRLGVVSDWQRGLEHFCAELGLGALDCVVVSADVGCEKPDPRLFDAARRRLGLSASAILHVGDRDVDVEGARAAGFQAVLIRREAAPSDDLHVLRDLRQLLDEDRFPLGPRGA